MATVKTVKSSTFYFYFNQNKNKGEDYDMKKDPYNLLNQRFGKLTVIELTRKNNKKAWLCQCDCGGTRIAHTGDLLRGRVTSCGCGRKKDITNQRFGKLIALQPTEKRSSNNSIIWECICDCGNTHFVATNNLVSGKVSSCGCLQREAITQMNKDRAHNLLGRTFGLLTIIEQVPNQGTHRRWKAKCACGKEILVTTSALLYMGQQSCGCTIFSKGENKIIEILTENNIKFKTEYSFDDLIFLDTKKKARYDFYLPDFNTLIEFDGKQHFIQSSGYYDNPEKFKRTQEHDLIKNQYAKTHNIKLIRIPYNYLDQITISQLLPDSSNFIVN